jgi:hypothetical protein
MPGSLSCRQLKALKRISASEIQSLPVGLAFQRFNALQGERCGRDRSG